MRLLFNLFILTIAQFSTGALANTNPVESYHIECDSCVTDKEFEQAAKDNAVFRKTVFINVMNIKNYEIKKYSVYSNSKTVCDPNSREPNGEGGFIQDCWRESTRTATEVAINNTELNAFIDFSKIKNDLDLITLQSIYVPGEVLESGYELVGASFNQTAVNKYFNSLPNQDVLVERIGQYIESVTTTIGNSYLKVTARPIVFEFNDGTIAHAVFKFIDMDNVVHLEFTQIMDSNGNIIDLTNANNPFSKQFNAANISQISWQSLLTAFKAYGLAVRGSSSKIIPPNTVPRGIVTITCSSSSSSETVCRNPL